MIDHVHDKWTKSKNELYLVIDGSPELGAYITNMSNSFVLVDDVINRHGKRMNITYRDEYRQKADRQAFQKNSYCFDGKSFRVYAQSNFPEKVTLFIVTQYINGNTQTWDLNE